MSTGRESKNKFLAISLLLVSILLIFTLLILPIYSYYKNTTEQIASLQHRLLQYKTIARKTKGISDKLEELEEFNQEQDYYFSGNKIALASAELQGIVKDTLNSQNAKIISTQPVTSGNIDERQVKIAVHCRADIISLRKLLYEIETHVPVLIIDKFNIGRGFRATYRDQLQNNTNEVLDIRFDVSGYMPSNKETGS